MTAEAQTSLDQIYNDLYEIKWLLTDFEAEFASSGGNFAGLK
jgi:hypothetical protein